MRSGREIALLVALALCACRGRGVRDRIERPTSEDGSDTRSIPAGTTTVRSVATPVPTGVKPRTIARAYAVALVTTKTHVYFGDADDDSLLAVPKAGAREPTRIARRAPVAAALVADAKALTWIASPGDTVVRLPLEGAPSPTTIRERE